MAICLSVISLLIALVGDVLAIDHWDSSFIRGIAAKQSFNAWRWHHHHFALVAALNNWDLLRGTSRLIQKDVFLKLLELLIFVLIDILGLSGYSYLWIQGARSMTILMEALLLGVNLYLCFARKLISFIKVVWGLQVLHRVWISTLVSGVLTFKNRCRILFILVLSQLLHGIGGLHHNLWRIHHHLSLLWSKLGARVLTGIVFRDCSAWPSCGTNLFETPCFVLLKTIFFFSCMNTLTLINFTGWLIARIHYRDLTASTRDIGASSLIVDEMLTRYFSLWSSTKEIVLLNSHKIDSLSLQQLHLLLVLHAVKDVWDLLRRHLSTIRVQVHLLFHIIVWSMCS